MRRSLIVFALLILAAPLAGQASDTTVRPLPEGVRVRVHAPGHAHAPIVGRYAGTRGDSLSFETREGLVLVPRFRVERLDVTEGRNRLHGTFFGALAGAAVGTVVYFSHGDLPDSPSGNLQVTNFRARDMVLGTGLGALMGAVIGVERWRPVAVSASGGGTSLGISVSGP